MLWRLCAIRSSCEPSGRGGRSAAIRRNRAWNSSFVARSSSLCEINLMISFVSSHGHRGLLATEERRRRLAEAGVRRKPRLKQSRRGAFVGKVKDVDGCERKRMNYSERELERGVSFREGLGGSGVPGGPYSRRVASFPQNPLGFRPSGTCLSRVCAPIVWASRSGVAPQVLWIKPRLEIIPPPL